MGSEMQASVPALPDVRQRWHPIETAPRDRWVWVRSRSGTISAVRWDREHRAWFVGNGWLAQVDCFFSHWGDMAAQPPAYVDNGQPRHTAGHVPPPMLQAPGARPDSWAGC